LSSTPDLFDEAACGLARTTSDGLFLHVNRRFCQWTGYAAQELCGRTRLQDLLTMGGRIFHQTHWHPLLQMQGSVAEVKLDIVHRDGRPLPMLIDATRHESNDTGFVHDIAFYVARDRDKYERELLQSRRKLELLVAEATKLQVESKDRALFAEQMVGIVSHDLRNPLSTIQMGATLLSRGDPSPNQLRILGRVLRAAERAHRLTADLLDFTQARIGKGISISRQRTNLFELLSNVVEELTLAYPGRRLVYRHDGALSCSADADRLSQMVGNLVSNAMAYGDRDAPVTVTSRVHAGSSCTVSVHNMGDPIPPDLQAGLFQPMVRGDGEAKAGRSVGLGLFIVAGIAKAHGGRVSVTSVAEGTTFEILFPDVLEETAGQPKPS